MLDSEQTDALSEAISEVMGSTEDSEPEQPEVGAADEGEPEAEQEVEPEETEEAEDSDEEQPEADEGEAEEADSEDDGGTDDEAEAEEGPSIEVNGKKYTARAIEALEQKGRELQSGVTRKYQELATKQKQADSTLQFLEGQLRAPLAQFEQVNWQELKTSDPAKYQELLGQYQKASQGFEQVSQARKQLQEQIAKEQQAIQAEKAREAVEVLQSQHPDWNTDLYREVLQYAVDKGAPQEEIASETRPWVISALLNQMRAEKARDIQPKPKTNSVKRTIKQKAAPKPRTPAQQRADQVKRDRALAAKGDRTAQARLNQSEVDAQIDALFS